MDTREITDVKIEIIKQVVNLYYTIPPQHMANVSQERTKMDESKGNEIAEEK